MFAFKGEGKTAKGRMDERADVREKVEGEGDGAQTEGAVPAHELQGPPGREVKL